MTEQSFYINPDGIICASPKLSSLGEEKIHEAMAEVESMLIVEEAERIVNNQSETDYRKYKYADLMGIPRITIKMEEDGFEISGLVPNAEFISLIEPGKNIIDFLTALSNVFIIIQRI